ncbi:MAG: proton-conducting transporter membrane subunit [Phycisphaeraceae bacterium]
MTDHRIILLCVIPLIAGLISIALINRKALSRLVGVASFAMMLGLSLSLVLKIAGAEDDASSILVSQMGGWSAPFGISVVFDSLSGILICAAAAVGLGAYVHSFSVLDPRTERRYFHPLMQLLMLGVNLSFMTGDLFNLFVAFEIMLMASYALLTIGGSVQQLRQAYKYILLNILASTIFLMAAGMVYGMFGTLNIADLARIVAEIEADPSRDLPAGFNALAVLFLLVFGLKGAFFPLWFWLPDTYYTIPISIAGLFGGLLTKVGVYTVARLFPLIFASDGTSTISDGVMLGGTSTIIQTILIVSAAFTMFLAVLGAVSQHHVRRILSVHVISQVGYMVFGIAVMTGNALAGCAFYMIQHMVVKCALFLCCGVMEKHAGTDDLDKLGGLLKRDWFLGVLFFIAAMSLVGLPPLSGFFGKMVIIREGFAEDMWYLGIIGLVTGAITLLSMLKIWSYGYWNPDIAPTTAKPDKVKATSKPAYLAISALVICALFLGLGAEAVYKVANRAGAQLENPEHYITAVLGEDAYAEVDRLIAQREAEPSLVGDAELTLAAPEPEVSP